MFNALYEKLEAANHSVSFCAHMMEMDPTDQTIADYESALDRAARVRAEIGSTADAELRRRDVLAGRR